MKKILLNEAQKAKIITEREQAIINSFSKTFNSIKRVYENEIGMDIINELSPELLNRAYNSAEKQSGGGFGWYNKPNDKEKEKGDQAKAFSKHLHNTQMGKVGKNEVTDGDVSEISTGLAQRAQQASVDKGYSGDESQHNNPEKHKQQGRMGEYVNPELKSELEKLGFFNIAAEQGGGVNFIAKVGRPTGGKAKVYVTKDGVRIIQADKILHVNNLENPQNANLAIQKIKADLN